MNASFLLRARALWILGIALVLAGLLPVLYLVALLGWQASTFLKAGSWVPLPAALLFADRSPVWDAGMAPILAFLPEFPSAWLASLAAWQPAQKVVVPILDGAHIGIVFAVLGIAVMALGAVIARRQMLVFDAEKKRTQDRLRRVREYRADEGRREPFIGPDIETGGETDTVMQRREARAVSGGS